MKTLSNHLFLYDKDCPLCRWYTDLFLKYKLLNEENRVAYQDIKQENFKYVDFSIARNKIALIDCDKQRVIYGIDAITVMLSMPFPFVKYCMKVKPIYWVMEKVYSFISMNRKIIIPVNCSQKGSCNPTRSWFWRIVFIVFCGLIVNIVVGNFFTHHLQKYFIGNALYGDTIYFSIQILFQIVACRFFKEKNIYDYLGQLAFVSFLGALLLGFFGLGISILQHFNIQVEMLSPFCYGVVFCFMFFEHQRRIKTMEIVSRLTYTWLLIRILMYPLAFIM